MTSQLSPSPKSLVAVVVTYNRLAQLQTTLARLLETAAADLTAVLVIDNASTDATSSWLKAQEDPRLHVHHSTDNLGGAGGFESGMRLAHERFDPDWIVVMDDDARPAPGALAAFHDAEYPEDCAAAAAVFFPDGRVCEMNRPSRNPFWSPRLFLRALVKGRNGYHIPYGAYETTSPQPIDLTSFVGLFISRRMIRQNGYPNPKLFLYGDDVIYTLHLRRQGFSIRFDPNIRFEHDCSAFQDDQRRVFQPLWKVYYTYRNGLIMYHLASGGLFWLMLPLLAVKWRLAAGRYGNDRERYLKLFYAALRDGTRGATARAHSDVLALASGARPGR